MDAFIHGHEKDHVCGTGGGVADCSRWFVGDADDDTYAIDEHDQVFFHPPHSADSDLYTDITLVDKDGAIKGTFLRAAPFWKLLDAHASHRDQPTCHSMLKVDGIRLAENSSMEAMELESGIQIDVFPREPTFLAGSRFKLFELNNGLLLTPLEDGFLTIQLVVVAENGTECYIRASISMTYANVLKSYSRHISVDERYLRFEIDGDVIHSQSFVYLSGNNWRWQSPNEQPTTLRINVFVMKPLVLGTHESNVDVGGLEGFPVALPTELLHKVFCFVNWIDPKTFLLSLPFVCRQWYSVVQSTANINIDTTWAMQEHRTGYRGGRSNMNPINDYALMSLVDRYPLAHAIGLANATHICTRRLSSFLATRPIPDEVLPYLTMAGIQYMLMTCRKLKHLDLTGCKNLDRENALPMIADLAPQLEVLTLTDAFRVTADAFRKFTTIGMTSLKNFTLPQLSNRNANGEEDWNHWNRNRIPVTKLEDDWFHMLGKNTNFPSLEVLNATQSSSYFGEAGLKVLAAGCPVLRVLDLGPRLVLKDHVGKFSQLEELSCANIHKDALIAIASDCLKMKRLKLDRWANNANADDDDTIAKVFAMHGFQLPTMEALRIQFPRSSLRAPRMSGAFAASIGATCQNLLKLEIDDYSGSLADQSAWQLGQSFITLTHLDVCGSAFTGVDTFMPCLLDLNVSSCSSLKAEGVESMLKGLSQLQHLDISYTNATNEWLQTVGANCPNLLKLSLDGVKTADEEGMLNIIRGCTKLTKLNMRSAGNIKSGEWLNQVRLGALAHLTSLDLEGRAVGGRWLDDDLPRMGVTPIYVDDEWASAFAKGCPLLEEIGFENNCLITDEAVVSFCKHCPLMKKVDLNWCGKLGSDVFQIMADSWPALTVLEICCESSTLLFLPSTLKEIAENCKYLKRVVVGREHQLEQKNAVSTELWKVAQAPHVKRHEERIKHVDPLQLKPISGTFKFFAYPGLHGNTAQNPEIYPEPEQSIHDAEKKALAEDPLVIMAKEMAEKEDAIFIKICSATRALFSPGVLQVQMGYFDDYCRGNGGYIPKDTV